MDPRMVPVKEWLTAHCMGCFSLDPSRVKQCVEGIRVREVDEAHVEQLYQRFGASCTINKDIQCIVFDFPEKLRPEDPDAGEKLLKHGVLCIDGNHSTIATARLMKKFPKNPVWKSYTANVYNVSNTSETRSFLRTFGAISNTKVSKGWDFLQLMCLLHDTYIGEALARKIDPEELESSVVRSIKAELTWATNTNKSSFDLYWSHAKRIGPVWDKMLITMRRKAMQGRIQAFEVRFPIHQFPWLD